MRLLAVKDRGRVPAELVVKFRAATTRWVRSIPVIRVWAPVAHADVRVVPPLPGLASSKDSPFFRKRGDIAIFSGTASGAAARSHASWRYKAEAAAHLRRRAAHAGRHDPGPRILGPSILSGPAWHQGEVDHRKFHRSRRPRHDGGCDGLLRTSMLQK